jgi:putative endonuclease
MNWLSRFLRALYESAIRGRRARAAPKNLQSGQWGEDIALRELKAKGYRVVGRRIAVGRDELDIVMRDGKTLVFVEVKTRASEAFGRPRTAVNFAKRRRLSRAAVRYLMNLREKPEFIRFDVVEVVGRRDGPPPRVEHIQNAFHIEGRLRLPW